MRGDTSGRVAGDQWSEPAPELRAVTARDAEALAVEALAARVRAAERALHAERVRLATLVDTLPQGVLLLDGDNRVTAVNETFRRLTELSAPAVGLDWPRLLATVQPARTDGSDTGRRLREAVAGGTALLGEELAFADGRVVELDVLPVDVDGQRTGTLVHARDVTARSAATEGRDPQLAAAAAMNSQFVATVAHELRGPLSSVVAFAHLLGDTEAGPLTEEQRSYLTVVDRNANRLLRLIEDLLLLSRLESRTLALRIAPVHLVDLLEGVVAERRADALDAGVGLDLEFTDGPALPCDEARIHQLAGALVGNAIKFTPAGGRVTVRARPVGTDWRIEVADNGIGIPAAELARLFKPFFRASNASHGSGRPVVAGSGLGLVVSRAVVELHGGTIHVASTEGAGTTVTVGLPARTRTKDGG